MIFVFNGPPGSGKDEACSFLENQYGMKSVSFKSVLFDLTIEHFEVDRNWFMDQYNDRIIKERKEELLGNRSRREALIYVSEELIKPVHGKDFFGVKLAEKLNTVSNYCVSDGGFREEIEPVINIFEPENVCIIQLYRDGCNYDNDSRDYVFGSSLIEEYILGGKTRISNLDKSAIVDAKLYQVHNNSSIENFHQTIRTIIRKELSFGTGRENIR